MRPEQISVCGNFLPFMDSMAASRHVFAWGASIVCAARSALSVRYAYEASSLPYHAMQLGTGRRP
jgi:hypothetical protein